MKAIMTGLLKGRVTRWGMLAGVLAAAGLSVAALGPVHYRLGGSFIGSPADSGDMYWSGFQVPLDSAGKTAALRVHMYSYSDHAAAILAMSGADTVTEGIGQVEMVSNDTAKGSLVFYGLKQGNPPLVKQIWTWDGIIKFTDPDAYLVDGVVLIYGPEADANYDGRPDPGAEPLLPPIPLNAACTRVLP